MMRSTTRRRGFTLVEMLVVLVIVLALTAMLVVAGLRMSDKNQVPNAAGLVQGMLAQAKTRALVEKRAVGVRFLISAQNPAGFPQRPAVFGNNGMYTIDQLQYVHDPGDFADGWVTSDYNPATPGDDQVHPVTGAALVSGDPRYGQIVYGPPLSVPQFPYTGFTFAGAVMPGDAIEFHGGGQAYFIIAVFDPTQTTNLPLGPRTVLVLDRPLDRPIQPPSSVYPRSNYRILRQPRPIAGEAPVSLPREIAIIAEDRTGYYFNPTDPPAQRRSRQSMPAFGPTFGETFADIMFSPSGQVISTVSGSRWSRDEALFLWLSDSPSAQLDPNNEPFDTNWAIVAVYTRTGGIAVYPVNQFVGPGANPYSFAQLGRGTGM